MKVLKGKNVIVRDGDLKRREQTNRNYLMSLTNDNLLFNYRIYVNDELVGKTNDSQSFYKLTQEWSNRDKVSITFPIGIRFIPLPDDENTGAFRFGPDVLAGISEHERILHLESDDQTEELVQENEREWGSWRYLFKTTNQDPGIQFSRIRNIGYDPYQVYFRIKK